MAKIAIGLGLALAALTALVVMGVFSAGNKPGYLTPNLFIADFNLALQILLVLGLTVGAWLARRGSIEAHRVNQTVWVLVNAALVLFMKKLMRLTLAGYWAVALGGLVTYYFWYY